jgi:cytochrome b6-f complex iron-sulfur subunit
MTTHAHANQVSGPRAQAMSRRRALSYAWWGAFGLMSATAAGTIGLYFWPNIKEGGFGSRINIGQPSALGPVGSVQYLSEAQLYVVRVPEGVLALWRKCPHLGCVVPWEANLPALPGDTVAPTGRFACPCHNSQYNHYGVIVSGPAPRPMDWFPISRAPDGALIVDTGKPTQRPEGLDTTVQVFPV